MAEIINTQILNWLALDLPADHWLGYLIAALIHAVLLIHVIAVGALSFIWAERKVSGRIQDRLGPTRVGGAFGWLQGIADGIKLLSKEDLMPAAADPVLFKISPYISFAASFAALIALPFASGWCGQHLNHAAFFILAIMGLEVFGVILGGYASGSKWSLFGGMREAAQVVSYEVPVGMCVLIPVMLCGTMNLVTIGDKQAGDFTNWLFFHDPFTALTFFVYFTCAMASVNRAPFDLAEAESELVAGFLTEYSGMRWSIFFMAEYGSMFMVSALAAILFFGGWNGPIPLFGFVTDESHFILQYIANLAGCINLIGKASLLVVVMMWIRWTFPRLRVDQVITMCWKYCVPIAAFCFIGVLAWQQLFLHNTSGGLIGNPSGTSIHGGSTGIVNEHWVESLTQEQPEESQPGPTATASVTGGAR
ncbi:MAG: NADH-quinone oxidoreductase subunit NuoH [Planctomycetota bacterium]